MEDGFVVCDDVGMVRDGIVIVEFANLETVLASAFF